MPVDEITVAVVMASDDTLPLLVPVVVCYEAGMVGVPSRRGNAHSMPICEER